MGRKVRCVVQVWSLLFLGVGVLLLLHPPCLFFQLTGWQCAGCGATRMAELLLQGDVREAFWQNPYWMGTTPLLFCYGVVESIRYVQGRPPLLKTRVVKCGVAVLLCGGLLFCVMRNL